MIAGQWLVMQEMFARLLDRALTEGDFPSPGATSWTRVNKDSSDQWGSSVEFVVFKCGDQNLPAVAKIQPTMEMIRRLFHSDEQFVTEATMYSTVLPYFGLKYADVYYVRGNRDHENDIIILQDLTSRGYRLTKDRAFISSEHIFLAMETIGKFHGLTLKHKSQDRFQDILKTISPRTLVEQMDNMVPSLCAALSRGIEPLLPNDDLEKALHYLRAEDFIPKITKPTEPTAVICHGDFCRNNMMFRYENETPIDCALFDFAMSSYSSPSIDISFFLYLNVSKEDRDAYWDTYLECYITSVKRIYPEFDVIAFKQDFSRRAIYGYYHCSFFQPIMTSQDEFDVGSTFSNSADENTRVLTTLGGQEATDRLVAIVKHLLDKGYVKAFIDSDLH